MYNRASRRCDQSWTTVSLTNTLRLTWLMPMYVQVSSESGARKNQICHCWIWGRPIYRCESTKLYGHFRSWWFMAKGTVWPDWVLAWMLHCKLHILGLDVRGEEGTLQWKWGSMVLGIPGVLTRWIIFSLCRKLVGYLPVCGWLCTEGGHNKTQSECGNLRMGWSNKWCSPHLNNYRKCWESDTWGSCPRKVEHQWGRNEHMGWCQLIGIGSPVREGRGPCWKMRVGCGLQTNPGT